MKFNIRWLKEFVEFDFESNELARKLTMAGLEVDAINTIAPFFNKVIIGEINKVEKHPKADKLKVLDINIGTSNLNIVCGAKNVKPKLKVAVATIGAELPIGLKIKKTKIRDIESNGMVCSKAELGLEAKSEGIMELDDKAPIGTDIREYLNLDDEVIELDLTPNRGDCFSILGIAREIGIILDKKINLTKISIKPKVDDVFETNLIEPQACPKYLTRVIKGVDNFAKIPKWMEEKLLSSGQTLHSLAVDVTNYVLLEIGQPLHVFDLDKLDNKIDVRFANNNEEIELLNNDKVVLNDTTLVIADNSGAVAIAGIMGGISTSTELSSANILLESAFFTPDAISGRARDYGLQTESSLRFERGVDFELQTYAIELATKLIVEIGGGKPSVISEKISQKHLPQIKPIHITTKNITRVLGFELNYKWILAKFKLLQFKIIKKDKTSFTIMPPSFRFDIRIAVDLIEELVRLYGYDKAPIEKLAFKSDIVNDKEETNLDSYKQILVNRDYREVITYSFISDKWHHRLALDDAKKITLQNPISKDMSVMRSNLWSGLLQTVIANFNRGYANSRFFESGLCFYGDEYNEQKLKLAGVISGSVNINEWSNKEREVDFYDIKADIETILNFNKLSYSFIKAEHKALQIGQTAKIIIANKEVGIVGALSPTIEKELSIARTYLFELDLTLLRENNKPFFKPFSNYQISQRDISIIIDDNIELDEILNSIYALNQKLLINVELFDMYKGDNIQKGKKSIALNLSYQSFEKTLTNEEIEVKMEDVVTELKNKFSIIRR